MKKISFISAIFLLITLNNCKKQDPPSGIRTDTRFDFTFRNENKEDLFDPNSNPHLNIEDLKLYIVNDNGIRGEYYVQPFIGQPNWFESALEKETNILRTIYVEVGNLTIDTIVGKTKLKKNALICIDKISYNGKNIPIKNGEHNPIPIRITIGANGSSTVEFVE